MTSWAEARRSTRSQGSRLARMLSVAALALSAATAATAIAAQTSPTSQDRTRSQRDELERIKRERAALEQKMRDLRTTVHDLSEERSNLDRQADATARVVRTLDSQILSLADEVADATTELVVAQDEMQVKRAILRYRVREIYKRGGMYSAEALLSAQSFGELLARYKYLHLVALRDRALVARVASLGDQIAVQRTSLVKLRGDTEQSREDKANEGRRLRALEQQRGRSLAQAETQQRATEARLAQMVRDEARIAALVASLDAERRRTGARPGAAAPTASTLKTSDLGRLDWPVEGSILYQFGRQVNPNNTTIRWNGIGIEAPSGTPVKAVSTGTVEYVDRFGTYGLMVVVNHGQGDYSFYSSLLKAAVMKGTRVVRGQVIGSVGTTDPELPPHLHFEIRRNGPAMDPLDWLRRRR